MIAGEIDVWRIRLDEARVPPPTIEEADRAARFVTRILAQRYLRAHGAMRAILRRYTDAALDFAARPEGKPYLPGVPELKFNLSHSRGMALVGVALEVEIGVDVEQVRDLPDRSAIAERFFPPSEAAAHAEVEASRGGRDFFRRWTRIEAVVKALGVGLNGIGKEMEGEWTLEEIEVDEDYQAAVAAPKAGMTVRVRDY
jgi:4'-phosphopantetheinyl transferase